MERYNDPRHEDWPEPRVETRIDGQTFEIVAEFPGFGQEEIAVRFRMGHLEIVADAPNRHGIERRLALPDNADIDGADLDVRDGLVVVRMPLLHRRPGREPAEAI